MCLFDTKLLNLHVGSYDPRTYLLIKEEWNRDHDFKKLYV